MSTNIVDIRQQTAKICICCPRDYTQRNPFEILLTFFDWFGTKRTSVWIQINREVVNKIRFRFDLIRFRKGLSVCSTPGKERLPLPETSGSRHNGNPIKGPLKNLNTIVLSWSKGFQRGPKLGPRWCRDTPVSRTAIRLIVVNFKVRAD